MCVGRAAMSIAMALSAEDDWWADRLDRLLAIDEIWL
jgi:hypothetical protein